MSNESSRWALNVGSVSGIPIRIHLTFVLLLVWVAMEAHSHGQRPFDEVLFICGLFGCILLHELGHALMARRFGVRTSDIVLYPFGGIASLASQVKPFAEFWIALAGPAVNFVLAILLLQFSMIPIVSTDSASAAALLVGSDSMVDRLIVGNVVLMMFNMIPAFPMDGGRVLRSLLAIVGVRAASTIASRLSQVLSVGFALWGVTSGNPLLLIIAVIIFSSASQELSFHRSESRVSHLKVSDVMIEVPHLTVLPHGISARAAIPAVLKSLQDYFPVLHGDSVIGVASKEDILRSASIDEDDQYIAGLARRDFGSIDPETPLSDATDLLVSLGGEPLVVLRDEKLLGLLTYQKIVDAMVWSGIERSHHEETH